MHQLDNACQASHVSTEDSTKERPGAASYTVTQVASGASGAGCPARRCCSVHQLCLRVESDLLSAEDMERIYRVGSLPADLGPKSYTAL